MEVSEIAMNTNNLKMYVPQIPMRVAPTVVLIWLFKKTTDGACLSQERAQYQTMCLSFCFIPVASSSLSLPLLLEEAAAKPEVQAEQYLQ